MFHASIVVLVSNLRETVEHLDYRIEVTGIADVVHPCVVRTEHWLVVLLVLQLLA